MKVFLASGFVVAIVAASRFLGLADPPPRTLGATESVTEISTGMNFEARIDTGAACTSMHCDAIQIDNPSTNPRDNIGKRVRFLTGNGERAVWIESVVADYSSVRNSEHVECRYVVPLTLQGGGVQKTVRVTLNNRASMRFPLLIGRNFLTGDFVVDVSQIATNQR